jgi:hypothetical protein
MTVPTVYSDGVPYLGLLELDDGWWIAGAFPNKPGEGLTKLLIVKEDEVKEDPKGSS